MKAIVVSSVPWNRNNNFGKTFCDIFEGMEDIEFLNIYCDSGKPENTVKAQYYQITITDLLKNLLKPSVEVGRIVTNQEAAELDDRQQNILNKIKSHNWRIFLWARRFVWWIGRWRTDELKKVIQDFDADFLFLPIFKESYMNTVQQYVMKVSGKQAVAYYGDDNYTLRLFSLDPFFWFDRLTQRRTVKKTIDACEYMYVVSDIEKEECERDFHKKCFICTKGANFGDKPQLKEQYRKEKRLVYTGNLGNHRWEELFYIGKALDEIDQGHKLVIYSGTPLTNTMQKKFASVKSLEFMGRVPVDDIPQIQSDADILVHVESFRLKERLLVHQSFSTKLVDHFARTRCTFGVGAKDVAFVDHLLKHDAAIVATSRVEIKEQLERLLADDKLIDEYAIKGFECGKHLHGIETIQANLRHDFKKYLGVECESINC